MKNGFKIFLSAALCLALSLTGFSAFADPAYSMSVLEKREGEKYIYHWEMDGNVEEVDFSDAGLIIDFAAAETGPQYLVRAGWLPELGEVEGRLMLIQSFGAMLDAHTAYIEYSDLYGKDYDELLSAGGLSREEAEEWFCAYELQSRHAYPYRYGVLSGFELFDRDLILGAYGAEAEIVKEGELEGRKLLEVRVDYSALYEGRDFTEEQWAQINQSVVKNYLFLFDEAEGCLIYVCGTMDFETYERIAESIELRKTELIRGPFNTGLDYIFFDMGKG